MLIRRKTSQPVEIWAEWAEWEAWEAWAEWEAWEACIENEEVQSQTVNSYKMFDLCIFILIT